MINQSRINAIFNRERQLMETLTRKPSGYDQVALFSCDDLGHDASEALLELPRFEESEIFVRGNAPYGDFTQPDMPVWFLLKARGKVWLVDTEGASYPRYMARLADMPEVLRVYRDEGAKRE